jgi:hypothetical protein
MMKHYYHVIIAACGLFTQAVTVTSTFADHVHKNPWTWLYTMPCNGEEKADTPTKKKIVFTKKNIPPATQLVFSFNALRPDNGYFSFLIRVRHARTQLWSRWYTMLDWGPHVQRSYATGRFPQQHYAHVRLEVGMSGPVDAFTVQAVAHQGADLARIASMSVAASDFEKFCSEKKYLRSFNAPSCKIKGVPCYAQYLLDHPRAMHLCSPTSSSMLLSYLTQRLIHPLDVAPRVYDAGLDTFGSWPFNAVYMFEMYTDAKIGSDNNDPVYFIIARMPSFATLHKQLKRNNPVMVSIRNFELPDGTKLYKSGHLLLVIGWDNKHKKVLCHDPAAQTDEEVYIEYPIASFIEAWERSHRLAYLVHTKHDLLW